MIDTLITSFKLISVFDPLLQSNRFVLFFGALYLLDASREIKESYFTPATYVFFYLEKWDDWYSNLFPLPYAAMLPASY